MPLPRYRLANRGGKPDYDPWLALLTAVVRQAHRDANRALPYYCYPSDDAADVRCDAQEFLEWIKAEVVHEESIT